VHHICVAPVLAKEYIIYFCCALMVKEHEQIYLSELSNIEKFLPFLKQNVLIGMPKFQRYILD
jgi:hypothetical protein